VTFSRICWHIELRKSHKIFLDFCYWSSSRPRQKSRSSWDWYETATLYCRDFLDSSRTSFRAWLKLQLRVLTCPVQDQDETDTRLRISTVGTFLKDHGQVSGHDWSCDWESWHIQSKTKIRLIRDWDSLLSGLSWGIIAKFQVMTEVAIESFDISCL
jgi:hypothetical protein